MSRFKIFFVIIGVLLIALTCVPVKAQSFDSSGTASLTGPYLFRYVVYANDSSGDLLESCSLTGLITFDGQGNYSTSTAQFYDTGSSCTSLGGGTYGVQSNGMAQLDNPLLPATLFGTFSQPVLIASSTEDDDFDLFIAVQAPASGFSNTSLSGSFTTGTLDFLNASATLARDGYFTLNADGSGNIAAFTITGAAANLSSGNNFTQNVAASTYSLSGTTGGTMTFPSTYGDTTQIISGQKALYVSADGNYFVGGTVNGSDIIFGFRAPSGASSSALLYGTYFLAGMEDYVADSFIDNFWGAINTKGDSNLIFHERFDDVVDGETYDQTFYTTVDIGTNGSYFDGAYYTYLAGNIGSICGGCSQAMMMIGYAPQYSLIVGIHSPTLTQGSAPWINPVGITNAANFTPITNAYTAGELVSLYGNFGVSTQGATTIPISTNLGGVQVLVNGQASPVLLVSQTQINAWMPYEVAGEGFATFQVVVNGTTSNSVTVYVDNSAPGIYTYPVPNGIGAGAILHANYAVVSDSSPAQPNETVQLYMNGLGTVTPPVADGAAASGNPVSNVDEYTNGDLFAIYLDDGVDTAAQATVAFAGLAPGLVGLYQVNFTVPSSGLQNGDVYIDFETQEASDEMATIAVSGFPQSSARAGRVPPAARRIHRRAASRSGGAADVSRRPRAIPKR
ncbi:MAG TPA: hypothetical protein VMR62_38455 [Bryobacteraceae bacterium]|jgi:uncharacterized protein (TIGR03437 family)|nr:hypothetical protein [Bryobacteraceae bacterium]